MPSGRSTCVHASSFNYTGSSNPHNSSVAHPAHYRVKHAMVL